MRRTIVIALVAMFAVKVSAETYAFREPKRTRTLKITREYVLSVSQGKPSEAAIPALMSFWGATNWQIVKASKFTYQEQPDSIEITSDNLGQRRKNYLLKWKAPSSNKISVKQELEVELNAFNKLYTRASLPYSEGVLGKFPDALGVDKEDGIDPNIPGLKPICDDILKKTKKAEEAVELVCDWINENITFTMGKRTAAQALSEKKGSCTPMSKLACSMLRYMKIPTHTVQAKFIGGDSGHCFIEVYYPDAGWVFYDLSNCERGFKSLDCLMTVGWSARSGPEGRTQWKSGYYCKEEDKTPFQKLPRGGSQRLRAGPKGRPVTGVQVASAPQPMASRIRHLPLSELLMDSDVQPGVREYAVLEKPELPDASGFRTWKDSRGKSIRAKLVSFKDGKATLQMAQGNPIPVPLTNLSPADQKYLKSVGEK